MSEVRCKSCKYINSYIRSSGQRRCYFCEHPNQQHIKNWFKEKRIQKMPGFLAYGDLKAGNSLPIKTSPAWCPLKVLANIKLKERTM